MHAFIVANNVTVGKLYQAICAYYKLLESNSDYDLFTHLYSSLSYDVDTDDDEQEKILDNSGEDLNEKVQEKTENITTPEEENDPGFDKSKHNLIERTS